VHGVNGAGYQTAFNNAVAAGFKPVLLAATGPANDPVFAGTFEQRPGPVPLTRFGLVRGAVSDPGTIDHWIAQARSNGWMPTSIAVYGNAADLRYSGIWVDNPQGICWAMDGLADSAADYQSRFDALVPAWARPVQVAVSPDDRYASIFRDDTIGEWVARHELTSAGYQQAFDQFVPEGFWPVSVQAGGVGRAARFAVVFAKNDQPLALMWRAADGPRGQCGDRRCHAPGDGTPPHPRRRPGARARGTAYLRARLHPGRARLSNCASDNPLPTGQRE
jgi:hypothetical protein